MIARAITLFGLAAAAILGCGGGDGSRGPGADGSGVTLTRIATGLQVPLDLTAPPGDARRLFIAEKSGRVSLVADGNLLATPFLDLRGQVSGGDEQGLLGLVFHPDYAESGRFFVNFTDLAGDTHIVEYRASANPDVANPATAREILFVDQPFSNHNGGGLAFGPDGFLYVALGDGGSRADPFGNAQNLGSVLGKLLRIDVDRGVPYAIPSSNPFAAVSGARGEIWSFGLRNPFRFSFDRANGDLYIGDVGQDEREEVDVVGGSSPGGENYGWNRMEGFSCFNARSCDRSGLTLPVLDYDHGEGCSVIGGYVYRGSAIPDLVGHYFFADFCEGFVRSFRFDGTASDRREWPSLAPGGSITSFGQDASGELYILAESGEVFRIAPRPR